MDKQGEPKSVKTFWFSRCQNLYKLYLFYCCVRLIAMMHKNAVTCANSFAMQLHRITETKKCTYLIRKPNFQSLSSHFSMDLRVPHAQHIQNEKKKIWAANCYMCTEMWMSCLLFLCALPKSWPKWKAIRFHSLNRCAMHFINANRRVKWKMSAKWETKRTRKMSPHHFELLSKCSFWTTNIMNMVDLLSFCPPCHREKEITVH